MNDWLLLHGLADGQLDANEKAEAERLLAASPEAREEFERILASKATLQDKCERYEADEVWAKCRKRLDELERVHRVEGFVGRYAWAICGMFFAAILIGGTMTRMRAPQLHSSDVVRASAGLTPLPAPASQSASEQQRWVRDLFQGVEPVRTSQIAVMGGAKGLLNGFPVTRLDLVDRRGRMEVFVILGDRSLEESGVREGDYATVTVNQANGLAWAEGGQTFLLVGQRSADELALAANSIRGR